MPQDIQERARDAFRRFQENPSHPGLRFKRVSANQPLWSARVSSGCRAVGVRTSGDEIIWFFIGSHADYDALLRERWNWRD